MSDETQFPTLDSPGPAPKPPLEAPLPEEIGGFRILSVLGRGGMGVVYEAEQPNPKRRVALKVIRGGRLVDELQLRLFRREAETLARLAHPNIAAIYEAGRTPDGQHFFTMELVVGRPLGDYLRERIGGDRPSQVQLRERLRLFVTICRAVSYAHQRGVIHRDLKPSNLLVVSGDKDAPTIKILDFGLARITDTDVQATLLSEVGEIRGTLPYMSPEQARGDSRDIDLRSDVYGLGVILYEMITGRFPYETETVSLVAALKAIIETPPRPLQQAFQGDFKLDPDLETIVGKALEKEPDRRYASAAALSEDVERYLGSQPILARAPSAMYRARKFVRRHRSSVAAAAALVLALMAAVVGTTAGLVRARRAEAEASRQAARARTARDEASQQAQLALGTVYDVVTTADETLQQKPDMGPLRKQLLEIAMKNLDRISRDAATSGKADRTMGVALQRMGVFYEQIGATDQKIKVFKQSLEIFERLMREEPDEDWNPWDAAVSYDGLGETLREIDPDPGHILEDYSRSLELRKKLVARPRSPLPKALTRVRGLAVSEIKLANLSLDLGNPQAARRYAEDALEVLRAAPATDPKGVTTLGEVEASAHSALARALSHLGDESAARRRFADATAVYDALARADPLDLGPRKELARIQDGIGNLELELGRPADALRPFENAQRIFGSLAEKDRGNLELLWFRANAEESLAAAHALLGNAEASRRLLASCLQARERLFRDDPRNIQREIEVMLVKARLGALEEAERIASHVTKFAPRHPGKIFSAARALALCAENAGRAHDPSASVLAEKGLAALRQATASGFRDAYAVKTSPDLASLRELRGYPELVAELSRR